jgi:hypothetical protein
VEHKESGAEAPLCPLKIEQGIGITSRNSGISEMTKCSSGYGRYVSLTRLGLTKMPTSFSDPSNIFRNSAIVTLNL